MFKIKGFKLVLICLLVTLSASCFSLLFVNAYSSFTKPAEPQAAAEAYDLNVAIQSGNIMNYYSHSEFLITTNNAFANFQDLVNGTAYGINQCMDFYGKTVKLTTDLDFSYHTKRDKSGALLGTFAGSFDGQGHTLSNITHTVDTKNSNVFSYFLLAGEYVNRTYYYAGSFASVLQGVVKNTRFKNTRVYIEPSNFPVYVGVVAGMLWSGSVYDCIVENVNFYSNLDNTQLCVSPLVGGVLARYFILSDGGILTYQPTAFEPNITDCIVLGDIFMAGHDKNSVFDGDDNDGMHLKYICCDDNFITWTNELATQLNIAAGNNTQINDGYNIKRIIFDAKITPQKDGEYDELNHCYTPENDENFTNNIGTKHSFDSAYKSGSFDSYFWHKYLDGYSHTHDNGKSYKIWLNAFIKWIKVKFQAVNCTITAPEGVSLEDYAYPDEYNKSGKPIIINKDIATIINRDTFMATPDAGCSFKYWSISYVPNATRLTAYCESPTYTFSYQAPYCENVSDISDIDINKTYNFTHQLKNNDTLTITIDRDTGTITYKPSDTSLNKFVYEIPMNKYTIINAGLINKEEIVESKTIKCSEINDGNNYFTIKPELKLNEYTLDFEKPKRVDGVEIDEEVFKLQGGSQHTVLKDTIINVTQTGNKITYKFNDKNGVEQNVTYIIRQELTDYFEFTDKSSVNEVEITERTFNITEHETEIIPKITQTHIKVTRGNLDESNGGNTAGSGTLIDYNAVIDNPDSWYEIVDDIQNNKSIEFKVVNDANIDFSWYTKSTNYVYVEMSFTFSNYNTEVEVCPVIEKSDQSVITVYFNAPKRIDNDKSLNTNSFEITGGDLEFELTVETTEIANSVTLVEASSNETKLEFNVLENSYTYELSELYKFVGNYNEYIEVDEIELKITITPIVQPLGIVVKFNKPVKEDGSEFDYHNKLPSEITIDYVENYNLPKPILNADATEMVFEINGETRIYSLNLSSGLLERFYNFVAEPKIEVNLNEIEVTPKVKQVYKEFNFKSIGQDVEIKYNDETVLNLENNYILARMSTTHITGLNTNVFKFEFTNKDGKDDYVTYTAPEGNVFIDSGISYNGNEKTNIEPVITTKKTIKFGRGANCPIPKLGTELLDEANETMFSILGNLEMSGLNTSKLTFTFIDENGNEVKIVYTADPNKFTDYGITDNADSIEVKPYVNIEVKDIIFEEIQIESKTIYPFDEVDNNKPLYNIVKHIKSNLEVSYLDNNKKIKFTFINDEDETEVVSYTIPENLSLYVFSGYDKEAVVTQIRIKPLYRFECVKLIFNTTDVGNIAPYSNGVDVTGQEFFMQGGTELEKPEDNDEYSVKFTLTDMEGNLVEIIYDYGYLYTLKNDGITELDGLIQVKPELNQEFIYVIFKVDEDVRYKYSSEDFEYEEPGVTIDLELRIKMDKGVTYNAADIQTNRLTFTLYNQDCFYVYCVLEEGYIFTDVVMESEGNEKIIVTPKYGDANKLIFNNSIVENITPKVNNFELPIADRTFYMKGGTSLVSSGEGTQELTFTFTDSSGNEVEVIYASELFKYKQYGIEEDALETTITPVDEQVYIYLKFEKIVKEEYTYVPSRVIEFIVEKDASIESELKAENVFLGDFMKNIVYRFTDKNEGSIEVVYENIPNQYKSTIDVKSVGAYNEDRTILTITPELTRISALLIFMSDDHDNIEYYDSEGVKLEAQISMWYIDICEGFTKDNLPEEMLKCEGIGTSELVYTFKSEGSTKTMRFNLKDKKFIFNDAGITVDEYAANITVKPQYELANFITFNDAEKGTGAEGLASISPKLDDVELSKDNRTFYIKKDSMLQTSGVGTDLLTFTFINSENKEVTITYSTPLHVYESIYEFVSDGIGYDEANRQIIVTPKVEQTQIEVLFKKDEKGNYKYYTYSFPDIKIDETTFTLVLKEVNEGRITCDGLETNLMEIIIDNHRNLLMCELPEEYIFVGLEVVVASKQIIVTPKYVDASTKLIFNITTTGNIVPKIGEVDVTGQEFKLKYGTNITSSGLGTTELTFSFTDTNNETVVVKYSSELYVFTDAGIGEEIDREIQITPLVSQAYIYVQFNNATIGSHTIPPTVTATKIDLNSLSTPTGLNTNVLTFSPTLDGVIKTVKYTTIENAYIFTDAGIDPIDAEHIQVTPVLNSTLKQVKFAEIEKATGESTGTYTVKNNTKITVNLNTSKNVLTFKFNVFNSTTNAVESKEVTYTSHELYIFSSAGWENNAPITEDTTITPTVSQAYIYVQFNNATIGTHIVIPTVTATKIDLNSLSTPTGLNTNVLTFSPTLDGVTKTVKYTTMENAYMFTDVGIVSVDAEHIQVTPVLNSTLKQVTFAEIEKATEESTGTYTVKNNTAITVTLNAAKNVLTFKFNAFNSTTNAVESKEVKYTSDALYIFSSAGWENNAPITEDTTITPTVSQKYIYVQFNNAELDGDDPAGYGVSEPKNVIVDRKIDIGSLNNTELNLNTLTFTATLDGDEVNPLAEYKVISNAYNFTGIETNTENPEIIQVTPVIQAIYIKLKFNPTAEINTRIVKPTILGEELTEEKYISTTEEIEVSGLQTSTITYTFTELGKAEATEVVYTHHELYVFTNAGIGEEADREIQITPVVEQIYIYVQFNNAELDGDDPAGYGVSEPKNVIVDRKIDIGSLNNTELNLNTLTFTATLDGDEVNPLAEYKVISNAYNFTGIETNTTNPELIEVTPVIQAIYIKLKFNPTAEINTRIVKPTVLGEELTEEKYILTTEEIEVSGLQTSTITYTFTEIGKAEATEVVYTHHELYVFTNAGIGEEADREIQITPVVEQAYIYVKFNTAEIDEQTFTPTETEKFKIEYKSGNYTIESEFVEDGVNNGTLTYTLNETEKEVVYSIHAAYTIKSDGITAVDVENIEITPVLEQAYILVTFGKTTGEAEISPNETNQIKVRYNSGNYISDGVINWTNCTLSYVVILADGSFKTITYTINPRAKYTFDKDFIPNEPSNVEEVTISPTLILKMYDVGFGEA